MYLFLSRRDLQWEEDGSDRHPHLSKTDYTTWVSLWSVVMGSCLPSVETTESLAIPLG